MPDFTKSTSVKVLGLDGEVKYLGFATTPDNTHPDRPTRPDFYAVYNPETDETNNVPAALVHPVSGNIGSPTFIAYRRLDAFLVAGKKNDPETYNVSIAGLPVGRLVRPEPNRKDDPGWYAWARERFTGAAGSPLQDENGKTKFHESPHAALVALYAALFPTALTTQTPSPTPTPAPDTPATLHHEGLVAVLLQTERLIPHTQTYNVDVWGRPVGRITRRTEGHVSPSPGWYVWVEEWAAVLRKEDGTRAAFFATPEEALKQMWEAMKEPPHFVFR